MTTPVRGIDNVGTGTHEYNAFALAWRSLMLGVQTATLVEVVTCTNAGGVSPIGRVTVRPLVNQIDPKNNGTAHREVFGAIYTRIQGGSNAVILDPSPNDIGLMVFCSRDISRVVAAMAAANPGSRRLFSWSDGVYVGGLPLGVTPTQYVQFTASGINIVGGTVSIQSTSGQTTIDGKAFLAHTHTGVTTGSGTSGPVGP